MFFEITIIDVAQLVGVLSRSSCGNIWKIRSWRDQRTRSGASLSNQQHAAGGIRSMLTGCRGWAGRSRSISHCPRSPTHSGPAGRTSRCGPSEAGRFLSKLTWIGTPTTCVTLTAATGPVKSLSSECTSLRIALPREAIMMEVVLLVKSK